VKHKLTLRAPTERARSERSWAAMCACGWEEHVNTKRAAQAEYRWHRTNAEDARAAAAQKTEDAETLAAAGGDHAKMDARWTS